MLSDFIQSLHHYAKGANTSLAVMFTVAGLIAAGLALLYVYFVARHHPDNLLVSFLLSLLLLAGGIGFGIVARIKRGDWSAIAYAVLAVFFVFVAVVSLLMTFLLLHAVY